ncbi:MAG: site-specific integrase [Xanthomonadales bacterium]|nr:site-specific integrase [Xanthomonadales bacterium]
MQTPLQPVKRGGVYHLRLHVPADLWQLMGRTQIWRSLRTGDLRIARQRARATWDAARAYFHHVRTRGLNMDRSQLDALARRYLSARFDQAEQWLAETTDEVARDVQGDRLGERGDLVTAALTYGDYSSTLDRARGLLPDADELTHAKLARRLLEAELEAIKAECRALSGEPLVFPSLVATAPAAVGEEPKETPRLSEVLAAYVEEHVREKKWNPKTRAQRETHGEEIVELLGDPRVGDVTKADMRALAQTIARLPSNPTKKWPGKTLTEVLELTKDGTVVDIRAPRSLNTSLQLVRSLFAWAVLQDMIPKSPAVVLGYHDEGDPMDKRYPLTDADIRALLAHIGDERAPYWWWIPRLLAYSGMRLSEAVQLRREDVHDMEGIQVFSLNTEGGRRLKNHQSRRIVPVHPRLIALGWIDYVQARPEGFLWPSPPRDENPKHGPGDYLSKRLNTWLRAAGVTDPKKVAAHSFRHRLKQDLEDAEVPMPLINAICGWKTSGTGSTVYGGETKRGRERMLKALSNVELPI